MAIRRASCSPSMLLASDAIRSLSVAVHLQPQAPASERAAHARGTLAAGSPAASLAAATSRPCPQLAPVCNGARRGASSSTAGSRADSSGGRRPSQQQANRGIGGARALPRASPPSPPATSPPAPAVRSLASSASTPAPESPEAAQWWAALRWALGHVNALGAGYTLEGAAAAYAQVGCGRAQGGRKKLLLLLLLLLAVHVAYWQRPTASQHARALPCRSRPATHGSNPLRAHTSHPAAQSQTSRSTSNGTSSPPSTAASRRPPARPPGPLSRGPVAAASAARHHGTPSTSATAETPAVAPTLVSCSPAAATLLWRWAQTGSQSAGRSVRRLAAAAMAAVVARCGSRHCRRCGRRRRRSAPPTWQPR
jgi:hypothetical protein